MSLPAPGSVLNFMGTEGKMEAVKLRRRIDPSGCAEKQSPRPGSDCGAVSCFG